MSEDIVDLVFALRGKAVALDYADLLWRELSHRLPWLAADELAGVHPLAGVSAGDTELYFTRRARLTLRLAGARLAEAGVLAGARLDLGGPVEVGAASPRPLTPAKVLYSSFVVVGADGEEAFMAACREELGATGVTAQLVCGKARRATVAAGTINGFSLMLHGLSGDDSLRVQHRGIGRERKRGCGIFVPHKAIAAVVE